jgi:hypothetical protein
MINIYNYTFLIQKKKKVVRLTWLHFQQNGIVYGAPLELPLSANLSVWNHVEQRLKYHGDKIAQVKTNTTYKFIYIHIGM